MNIIIKSLITFFIPIYAMGECGDSTQSYLYSYRMILENVTKNYHSAHPYSLSTLGEFISLNLVAMEYVKHCRAKKNKEQ